MERRLGIYIHLPFCLKKCDYCDFCSYPGSGDDLMLRYTEELCRRMRRWSERCGDALVDTVYFGGGTPTLLPISCFQSLMECLKGHYRWAETCEITCECNPATADQNKLSALRDLGINRLSIGLQSTHDEELKRIGRAHSYEDFLRTFKEARRAGFDNISVDLMYGLPDQSPEGFAQSLSRLCSSYLAKRGYRKYEISNFCKEGRESRHNLRYWRGEEYLGFGVAAHSYFEGERFGCSRDLWGFLAGQDIVCERAAIGSDERDEEYVMLGLRLAEGLALEEFVRRFGMTPEERYPLLGQWIDADLMRQEDGRLFFTDRGFFVSNAILSEMLSVE